MNRVEFFLPTNTQGHTMDRKLSISEAQARLPELIRRVGEFGGHVTIVAEGIPVAEIRPVPQSPSALAERIQALGRSGVLQLSDQTNRAFPLSGPRKPGVLERLLKDSRT